MRIFVGSDFHADHQENMDWLRQISTRDYRQDVLIVAGDVANGMALFQTVMELLAQRFFKVLYVPGNHDLWVDAEGQGSSFDKFQRLRAACADLDIGMEPLALGNTLIVPLFGWYDYSFGRPAPSSNRPGWITGAVIGKAVPMTRSAGILTVAMRSPIHQVFHRSCLSRISCHAST